MMNIYSSYKEYYIGSQHDEDIHLSGNVEYYISSQYDDGRASVKLVIGKPLKLREGLIRILAQVYQIR